MAHSLRLEDEPRGRVLHIVGDADVSAAEPIDAALASAAGQGSPSVTVDLEQTTMLDSRTIGVLVDWSARLREAGGSMPIVCHDANIRRLFSALGLDKSVEFADRESD